jgi:hypothetical protein
MIQEKTMFLEQSAKNSDEHWNTVFRKATWYLMMLMLAPWLALFILMMIGLLDEYFTGELGRNGGMTGLFQSIGLHPHATYEALLWITISGVFLAMAWLFWHAVAALFEAAGHQIQKTGLGAWITRKTTPLGNALAHFENAHPNILASLVMVSAIVAAIFMNMINMSPTPKNRMIVSPPAGSQIVQASPYSRVLLEVPNMPVGKHQNGMPIPATHTISGKAVVTQTGPQSYQVRMIP